MLFQRKLPVAWLIAGLGNPGPKYENTRHNAGFQVLDRLAQRAGVTILSLERQGLTARAEIGGQGVLLLKPMTYMNESGQSVGENARFYKLPPERVLVVSDDISLPLGKLRLRRGGSAGGHNGLKSIIQHLGTDQFPRLKLGVGSPLPGYDMIAWVLGKFPPEDAKLITDSADRAAAAIETLLSDGFDRAMNRFN